MSTPTIETTTQELAIGQPVITSSAGDRLLTIQAIEGPVIRLTGGSTINSETAHVVPEPASRVQFRLNGDWHAGVWLGCQPFNGGFKIEWITGDGALVSRTVARTEVPDARGTVVAKPDPVTATLALLHRTEVQAHAATVQQNRERMDNLVERAHEEADNRDWCEDFDDLMEELGLPRRIREYEVSVEATVSLYLTVSGTSEGDAAASVDVDDIRDAIANYQGTISYEAEVS